MEAKVVAQWLEWMFWCTSVILLITATVALRDALKDEAFINARRLNGPYQLIAERNVRDEMFRLAKGSVLFFMAVLSIVLPPPPPDYRSIPQVMVTMTGANILAILMTSQSLWALFVKKKLKKYAAELPPDQRRRREDF